MNSHTSPAGQPSTGQTSTAGQPRIRAASPAALLALIPQLLGFAPEHSLVVIGAAGPRNDVQVTLRYDLPGTDDTDAAADIAAHAARTLAGEEIGTAVAAGYGPEQAVGPLAAALAGATAAAGIALREFLRVENGRYWSYVCTNPACCPPEGTPFSPVAPALPGTLVLARRADLAALLAPAGSEAMRRATDRAARAAAALRPRAAAAEGLTVTGALIAGCRAGGKPATDAEAARATVALRDLRCRDDAWARMDPRHVEAHKRLWADLTRRAQPWYIAAPAALLAFTAWQDGDGALANAALDRSLADIPGYSMAMLLRRVIGAGAPPSLARLPMTPEEVAASYDGTNEE